jgi:flavin-dependent dehydrogenase
MGKKICIAGAGSAGLHVARDLALTGAEVHVFELLAEEKLRSRHNWSDAVELGMLHLTGLPIPQVNGDRYYGEGVKKDPFSEGLYEPARITHLPVFSADYSHKSSTDADFHYICLDRPAFCAWQLEQVKKAGVTIHFSCTVKGLLGTVKGRLSDINIKGIQVLENGNLKDYPADLVIDASGVPSVLRTLLEPPCISTPLNEKTFSHPYRTVRRFKGNPEPAVTSSSGQAPFSNHYRLYDIKGYSWIHFHDHNVVDIGSGYPLHNDTGLTAKDKVMEIIKSLPQISDEEIRGGEGIVATGDPPEALVANGFAVLGDTAAMPNPRNGCGVGGAVIAGSLLAQTVALAPDCSISSLWPYAYRWFTGRGGNYVGLVTRGKVNTKEETAFLMKHYLLNGETLTNGYNGIFSGGFADCSIKIGAAKKENEQLLQKMAQNGQISKARYLQFMGYPPVWNADQFDQWYEKLQTIGK